MALKEKVKKDKRKEIKTSEKETTKHEPMNPKLIKVFKWVVGIVASLFLAVMILARVMASDPVADVLTKPEKGVERIVSPIQNAFANVTDFVVSYLRKIKLRSNLELEYNKLKSEYDQLVYQAMLADELETQLAVYKDLVGEMSLNESMQPIMATVIGQDEKNYSATFIINKGLRDGIEDFMAVTVDGALVGYTYNTNETTAQVKAIIDTDASIPALIESTRDQGTIRGTLGVDGTAMCRMYHSDDYIPRPGDKVVTSGFVMPFPKGIPIGVVRESTRGMEANKQYIVVEPLADFSHIEYVIVYRYQPIPGSIQSTSSGVGYEYEPLSTARPVPTIQVTADNLFASDVPPSLEPSASVLPTLETVETPSPTVTVTASPIETETADEITYNDPNASPTPEPSPTDEPTPSPTPPITVDDLTVEDD